MGFSMDVGVPVVTVFLQGLLSFFSPCVLPLVPLYLGYLSGGAEQGELYGKRGRLFVNTICFVIGISSAFFMMGLGVSAAGSFLNKNQAMVSRIGGILVILFGLYQLGIFGKSKLLGTEHRFWLKLDKLKMSPVVALVFGFTFSFAWTPCVGPALASVLLMAGSAGTQTSSKETTKKEIKEEKQDTYPATDFVLQDQYGKEHSLADYKGKTIFLNFWATWCGPCRNEMPEIQKIYEETQQEEDSDLVILGIAAPGFGQEGSQEEIEAFLEENGYTYPVLMDTTGEVFMQYGISAYPTTFMVDKDGNLFGYVQGQLNEDMMRSIIRQTMEGKRE